MAKGAGHSWATVRRAKEVVGVTVSKHGFQKDAGWTWELPPAEDAQSPTPETLSTFAENEHLRENPEENGTLFDG
ncbi:MAG: hypothetical protein IH899_12360 [Planctomycetes bacterium]|nr:hypothetical protein [Planctomycetota bacterium]